MPLELSDQTYRQLFEKAPFGLALCTMSGDMIAVNEKFASIIGRSVDETISELKISYWNITPDVYKEQEYEQIKRIKDLGFYGPYLKEYIHKEGHTVPVQLQGGRISFDDASYIWSSVVEVSSLYRNEVFEDAPYPLAVTRLQTENTSDQGELVAVSNLFANTLGYSVDEVMKLSYWDLTPVEYREEEDEQLKRIFEEGSYGPYTKHYIHKDGDLVKVVLRGRIAKIRGKEFVWSIATFGGKQRPEIRAESIQFGAEHSQNSNNIRVKRNMCKPIEPPEWNVKQDS